MSIRDLFRRAEKASPRELFSILFPQQAPGMKESEYLTAYTSGWVFACVRKIAEQIALAELTVQEKTSDGWKDSSNTTAQEALSLLSHVNPSMTSDDLYKGTQSYLELAGNGFWYVAYNGRNAPAELWLLDPTKITVKADGKGGIAGYIYRKADGKDETLKAREVVPFIEFNPTNHLRGVGTVAAAAYDIDIDTYAATWNRNFFFNSAMPSMALSTEANLTDEQYTRLMRSWEAKHRGLLNAHRPAVLEGGLKVDILNSNRREMDFIEEQKLLRDKILALFGVPKAVLGITEDVNRANAEASEYVFAKYTVMPRVRFLATRLSEFYLPMWGLSPVKYRFAAKDMVPQNVETELKRKQTGLATGFYTINEVRAEEGLEEVEGGDTVFVPSTMKPIDLAINPPAPILAPGQAPQDEDQDKQKSFTKASTPIADRSTFLREQITDGSASVLEVFAQQRKSVIAGLTGTKDLDSDALAEWEQWVPILAGVLAPVLEATFSYGGKRSTDAFDPATERVLSWIRERGLSSATSINETIKTELRRIIAEGVENGKGSREIALDLGSFFDEQAQWRALRIARTEVVEAYAQGSLEGARQAGMEEKRWITAGDANVDPECALNQAAGWIGREVNFPTGHIAPVIHPNCRCTVEFRALGASV